MNRDFEIKLDSLSPLSFDVAKIGDEIQIKFRPADKREYRDKIGAAKDCFLVFKGNTKIGMIPRSIRADDIVKLKTRRWRIITLDQQNNLLAISSID